MAKSHRMWTVLFVAVLLLGVTFAVSAQTPTPSGLGAVTGTPTSTPMSPTQTAVAQITETAEAGNVATQTAESVATAGTAAPTTGPGTPTSTPVARLPVTGGDGPTTPWGLILLVPGVAVLLVGLSMALITRRR